MQKVVTNRLREIIDSEGFTQAQLHKESGVNLTTINKICSGKNITPTPAIMSRIVRGLNTLTKINQEGASKYNVQDIFTVKYD